LGESGTGKELVAKAIHEASGRKGRAFVAVDSGALSSELLASELFGHVKGAFTSAVAAKRGLFEVANGGTIFLDEIGNINKDIQGKLLRVLQERTFMPVGGTEVKKVDVRMIFATNRDLKKMAERGDFREDLYYRLYVFPIVVPPLAERREDIARLAYWFLRKSSAKCGKKVERISDEVLEVLAHHDWPGNVRQLENTIERMVVLADGEALEPRHLPASASFGGSKPSDGAALRTADELKAAKGDIRRRAVEAVEREFILNALTKSGWNVTKAAKEVGILRPNFQALMRRHNISARGRK
jgi:transcriptional regulator with GAF, ATPase, and Fis domain